MKTSFDDIRKIAFRALDAAGAPPGTDDDGGWACAWLEAAGLPGLEQLADLIEEPDDCLGTAGLVASDDGVVDAAGQSAITLGGILAELAVSRGGGLQVKNLRHSTYMAAYTHRLSSPDMVLKCAPLQSEPCDVSISAGNSSDSEQADKVAEAFARGLDCADEPYDKVYRFSRRILVPQTEQSLLSGAGAGLTDND